MADVNLTSRIARDPLTGENYKVNGSMTFDEWKNSLSDEQKNALELHVKQMRNRSADKVQYEKYSQIFGKEFPKTLDDFVDMKYNDSDRWEQFKSEKQERLNQMDFKDMNGLVEKLGNKEVRLWYKAHDENILNLIDQTASRADPCVLPYPLPIPALPHALPASSNIGATSKTSTQSKKSIQI